MRLSPEFENPRLVITILRDPHPPARIPAKGHGLGNHRLRGKDINLEAILDLHLLERIEGRQGNRIPSLPLRKPPQYRGVAMPGKLGPLLGQLGIVELPGIDQQAMPKGGLAPLADLPVTIT